MASTGTQILLSHKNGAIELAVEHLIAGRLVAVPTETVYGLAADAHNSAAVQHIFEVKDRPANNPLICHVAGKQMARRYVTVTETADKLMDFFWPGPLTLVLPKLPTAEIPTEVSANLKTLAVRCPAHEDTRSIIEKLQRPIAAPSANPSGKLSPTSAADVMVSLAGKLPLILDGGPTKVGIESTIVGIENDRITLLRPGTVTVDEISEIAGQAVYDREDQKITAPGQLKSHYAPNAAVRLNAHTCHDNEVFIGFGEIKGDFSLSSNGNLREAARLLFHTLRKADSCGKKTIAVAPIPMTGIGIAINDRLNRAAAPRPTK